MQPIIAFQCTQERAVVSKFGQAGESAYRPGQPGNEFKPEVAPADGETAIPKKTNSAFIGTALEPHLRNCEIRMLVVAGVSTNNSVEATVRMAGNLGFQTYLIADACFTFGRRDFQGRLRTADEVHTMSLANLSGEYCTVLDTAAVLEERFELHVTRCHVTRC